MSFGANREVHTKHKFLVQTQKLGFAAFQKCSELSYEIAKIEYFEGGALIPIKVPGRITFSDVTLERGSSADRDFHKWGLQVADASKGGPGKFVGGQGARASVFKTDDVAIQSADTTNMILREWTLYGAWPIKYVSGDWDNTTDDVVIESLTLTYDHYTMSRV